MSATVARRNAAGVSHEEGSSAVGPLLIATDGSPDCDGAVRATAALATRQQQPVEVLAVLDALVSSRSELGIMSPAVQHERERADALALKVQAQLERLAGNLGWPLDVRVGLPAQTIASRGDLLDAPLIVMGRGTHRLSDRLFGSETVLYVTRRGRVPVWSVPDTFATLPRAAIMAIDFSEHSIHAARAALTLLPDLEEVQLVHSYSARDTPGIMEVDRLERIYDELGVRSEARVVPVILEDRDAGDALVRHAAASTADVIVVGAHGKGYFTRLVSGSVSTRLLRDAVQSLLIVPPSRTADSAQVLHTQGQRVASAGWRALLEEFSSKHTGQSCLLEVDDAAVSAMVQASRHAFIDAAYDPREARITIQVSDLNARGASLTRTIDAVSAVHAARDGARRDFLHVSHGGGQTLLTF